LDRAEALSQVQQLYFMLGGISQRDPDQEVQGIALPVLDAVLKAVKDTLGDHLVVAQMYDIISVESIEEGEPIRAVDAYLVAGMLMKALGHETPRERADKFVRRDR
jgi:hypothetical protein